MRLVAVSVVKNEADIIEAFVRHTHAWVDHHLIFDHESTDGTREILGSLQSEGLPLTLFQDDSFGNLQQLRSNYLTRLAAQAYNADWILLLDADEILVGPDRGALEDSLRHAGFVQPVSLPLLDYYTTTADDISVFNPILRLRHCRKTASSTRKIFIPKELALDPTLVAGKGSHALYRGTAPIADLPLPSAYCLAHLALRSPQHQVLRVVCAELQRISRGRAAAGLDVHYRLGYQLLAENPELFFATVCPPVAHLRQIPIRYHGNALRYSTAQDWSRVPRALLPYLEQLASSHGRLADASALDAAPTSTACNIREIPKNGLPGPASSLGEPFAGFTVSEGWGPAEGPVPEAFLPEFHWGFAPMTTLLLASPSERTVRFIAEALTYSEQQILTLELNDTRLLRHAFGRVNHKETLSISFSLRPGENRLTLRYTESISSAQDPRRLAVIFLSLRILPA